MDSLRFLLYFGSLVFLTEEKRDKEQYCTVCRIIIDELTWDINSISPNRKIQVGNYVFGVKNAQTEHTVPYATSDVYIAELMENVCKKMGRYSETNINGKKQIIRTYARKGKVLSLGKVSLDMQWHNTLKYYCDSILEDIDEVIVGLLKENTTKSKLENVICHDVSEACTREQLSVPLNTGAAEVDEKDANTARQKSQSEENTDTGDSDDVDDDDEAKNVDVNKGDGVDGMENVGEENKEKTDEPKGDGVDEMKENIVEKKEESIDDETNVKVDVEEKRKEEL